MFNLSDSLSKTPLDPDYAFLVPELYLFRSRRPKRLSALGYSAGIPPRINNSRIRRRLESDGTDEGRNGVFGAPYEEPRELDGPWAENRNNNKSPANKNRK